MAAYMPEAQSAWQYPELFQAWNEGNIAIMHTGSFFTGNLISHGDEAMDWNHRNDCPSQHQRAAIFQFLRKSSAMMVNRDT